MENRSENCLCRSTTGLFIAKRPASLILAAFMVCCLLSFLTGYFLGRRQPIVDLTAQLSSALAEKTVELNSLNNPTSLSAHNQNCSADIGTGTNSVVAADQDRENSNTIKPAKQYYGTLLGFSNLKAAQRYLNKLQNAGYNLQIKTRHSRNSKNKLYTWYQIVTEKFTDQAKLEQLVQELKVQENLSSPKVLEI